MKAASTLTTRKKKKPSRITEREITRNPSLLPVGYTVGKFVGDVLGGVAFGVGAGLTERYLLGKPKKNPGNWPAGKYQVEMIDHGERRLKVRTPKGAFTFFGVPPQRMSQIIAASERTDSDQVRFLLNLSGTYSDIVKANRAIPTPGTRPAIAANPGDMILTTPSKLEAEKIVGWIGGEGMKSWLDVHGDLWAVKVPRGKAALGKAVLGRVLSNPRNRAKVRGKSIGASMQRLKPN